MPPVNRNAVLLYDADDQPLAVIDGQTVDPAQPGLVLMGKGTDGLWHPVLTDDTGKLMVDVTTAIGDVVADQGDPNTNANAWPVKISDGADTAGISTVGAVKALKVDIVQSVPSGTPQVDESAFTEGVSLFTPIGGEFQEAGSNPTAGQAAAARITEKRALHTNLRDAAGAEKGVAANPLRVDAFSLPLPTGAATEVTQLTVELDLDSILANQTNGTQKAIVRGGTKGATVAADVTSTAEGADHQALDVQIYHGGVAKDPTAIRPLTSADVVDVSDRAARLVGKVGIQVGGVDVAVANPVPVSSADGALASVGTTTDAEAVGNGTVIALLKRLRTLLAAGLPAALVGGRLDTNIGSWLGSLLPTVGQKPMASSVPVTLASDQTALSISIVAANATVGLVQGLVALGGGTSGTENAIRATTYTEQSTDAPRSIGSSSASDAAAGIGAQQVMITYYDSTGAGPFTETVTLNGVTPVNTVSTTICFIGSLMVTRVGSSGTNVGTLTLFVGLAGAGGTIGTVGVGNLIAAKGDSRTLWAHRYVPTGKVASLATVVVGMSTGTGATNGTAYIRVKAIGVTGAADELVGDLISVATGAAVVRQLGIPLEVLGPARITAYGVPSSNNSTMVASFDFSEVTP